MWDSFGDDSEFVPGIKSSTDSGMFGAVRSDDGLLGDSSLLVNIEFTSWGESVVEGVVVLFGFSAILVLINGSGVSSVEDLPVVGDGWLEFFGDNSFLLLWWFLLLLFFLFGTSASHVFQILI